MDKKRKLSFIVSDLYHFLPFCQKLTETGNHDVRVFLVGRAQTDLYAPFKFSFDQERFNTVKWLSSKVKFFCECPSRGSREEIFEEFKKANITDITYDDFIVESLNSGYEILQI